MQLGVSVRLNTIIYYIYKTKIILIKIELLEFKSFLVLLFYVL